MKIMIPLSGGLLTPHFGHCQEFVLIEVEKGTGNITSSENLVPPPHEPGVLPRWVAEQGTDLLIAGGLGQKARKILEDNDVRVITGAPSQTPEAVVKLWQGGEIREEDNRCINN